MTLLLGAHMSIAGGLDKAFERGEAVGCTAMQVFTANASRWKGKPITAEAAARFRTRWQESSIGPVFSHDSYLINLASQKEDLWQKSKAAFLEEMQRCHMLGLKGMVMHPGAHLGAGEEAGLKRVRDAFDDILREAPDEVMILIENTAAQGTCLGGPFQHIATLLADYPQNRFGVCFDTCHACAAGYDLATEDGYQTTMGEFDRLIGLERIQLFHVNDSKKECGARVDRHAHIGAGAIGRSGFASLMQDSRLAHIPKILETPKGEDDQMDRTNLALLRELAGTSS